MMERDFFSYAVGALVLTLSTLLNAVLAPPSLPYNVWGLVTTDGLAVPAGTSVTAWIDGVRYATTITLSGGWYTLNVPGDDPDEPGKQGGEEGETVAFKVGACPAPQTGTWSAGVATRIDLETLIPAIPSLTSPGNAACTVGTTLGFHWGEVTGATSYRIQVDNDAGFGSPEVDQVTSTAAYTPTTELDTHYWRVNACNACGCGYWSPIWSFSTAPPGAPSLQQPPDGWTHWDATPELQWQAVAGATEYEIQMDDDAGFGSPVVDDSTTALTYVVGPALSPGTYHWRVRARDHCGAGPWSGARELDIVEPKAPALTGVVPDSGWTETAVTRQFTATFTDPNGWQDLRYVYLKLQSQATPKNFIAVRYDPRTNTMSLNVPNRDTWRGARTPGVAGVLRHACGSLDAGQSSATRSGNTVTVTWALQFRMRLSGQRHDMLMRAEDAAGADTGWVDVGDWVVNRTPNYLIPPGMTIYPSSPPEQHFTRIGTTHTAYVGTRYWVDPAYRDLDREWTLDELYLFIGKPAPAQYATDAQMPDGVYLKYVHNGNKDSWSPTDGRLYVWDNGWQGPYTPGDNIMVDAEHVKVRVRFSKPIWADFRTIKVLWRLEFESSFVGTYGLYMRAIDTMGAANGGDTGWRWKSRVIVR